MQIGFGRFVGEWRIDWCVQLYICICRLVVADYTSVYLVEWTVYSRMRVMKKDRPMPVQKLDVYYCQVFSPLFNHDACLMSLQYCSLFTAIAQSWRHYYILDVCQTIAPLFPINAKLGCLFVLYRNCCWMLSRVRQSVQIFTTRWRVCQNMT